MTSAHFLALCATNGRVWPRRESAECEMHITQFQARGGRDCRPLECANVPLLNGLFVVPS